MLSLSALPWMNLRGYPVRTGTLVLFSMLMTMTIFGGTLIVQGIEHGLRTVQSRLGADIMVTPAEADTDRSSVLSAAESIALALALSSDGLAAGLGGGFSGLSPWSVFFCSAGMNLICILAGCFAGRKAAKRANFELSWLGGGILLGMGLLALL